MEFVVESKYNIGDVVNCKESFLLKGNCTVIDVELRNVGSGKGYYITYLCERDNRERMWASEENLIKYGEHHD